jgi:secretory protein of YscJ/FliF family/flagellar assembly protein FliH
MATETQLEKAPPALGQVLNGGRFSGLWSLAWVRWAQLAQAQRSSIIVAALMMVALLGGLFWYGLSPDWRTLYSGLEPDDARQMEQVLTQAQIPFEPSADGSGILVPAALLDKARLTGAVRVALGQVAATSEIRLRVPAREADLWRETIALLPNLIAKPLVVADETMLLGECVIESKAGTVDLGIRSQLGEIERGFFDRAGSSDASPREAQITAAPHTPAVETRA